MPTPIAPSTAQLDFVWAKGTPFSYAFAMRDTSGRRINLSRSHAAMAVRAVATDTTTPLAMLTTENGHLAFDPAKGEITILVSTEEILGLSWSAAVYDLLLFDPDGVARRIYEGAITVVAGVTRLGSGTALPTA